MDSNQNTQALTQRLQTSLKYADEFVKGRKKANSALLITGMTSSAAATLIAGLTAAQGPIVGSGPEGWRLACIVAAVFGFAATISNGIHQQLKVNEKLVEGTQCLIKLRSLDLGLTTGTKNWEEISSEYEELVKAYPDFTG